jgi:hypothetical protein
MLSSRLCALIQGLSSHEFEDLSAFFAYRGLRSRLAGKLLDGLRNSPDPMTKEQVCEAYGITDATFRTVKSEMEKALLEWSILNTDGWVTAHLRNLIASHVLLHWGESQRAWKLAHEVQHQATADSHFAVARLALELRSALVQYVHPDDASNQMNVIVGEIDQLAATAEVLKTVSRLYVKAGTLATSSMLLRSAESIRQFEEISQAFGKLNAQFPDLPFNTWAYHIQTEALLAQMRGDEQHAFRCYDLLWVRMNTDPKPIPVADHRFYQHIQTYILSAISAKAWPKAIEVDLVHKRAIAELYGNPPLLKGMNHAFSVLIDIGHRGPDPARLKELSDVISYMARAKSNANGDFNIFEWNLHMASAMLPLLLRHCFDLAHESQILTPRKKGTSAHHRYLPLTHDGRKHTPEESGTDHSTGPCHLFPTQRRPVCQRRHADGDAGAHQSRSGAGQSVPQHIRCTRQRGDPQGCENTYQGSAQILGRTGAPPVAHSARTDLPSGRFTGSY